jgi:hypothetical protein
MKYPGPGAFLLSFSFCLGILLLPPGNAIAQHRGKMSLRESDRMASAPGAANRTVTPPRNLRKSRDGWAPPDIDQFVPPVAAGVACRLPDVLAKAGQRVEELIENVNRFSATEVVKHQRVDGSGRLRHPQTLRFSYLVSIAPTAHGYLNFQEFRNRGNDPAVFPDHIATIGMPSLVLIFHPHYVKDFRMKCEGLGKSHSRPAWQVRFEQRPDRINHMNSLVIDGRAYSLALRGRAWILADSYEVARLETDLVKPIPQIRLRLEHEDIEYRSVHFPERQLNLWLPSSADLYMDFIGHRFYRRDILTNFHLFSVDVQQQFNSFR